MDDFCVGVSWGERGFGYYSQRKPPQNMLTAAKEFFQNVWPQNLTLDFPMNKFVGSACWGWGQFRSIHYRSKPFFQCVHVKTRASKFGTGFRHELPRQFPHSGVGPCWTVLKAVPWLNWEFCSWLAQMRAAWRCPNRGYRFRVELKGRQHLDVKGPNVVDLWVQPETSFDSGCGTTRVKGQNVVMWRQGVCVPLGLCRWLLLSEECSVTLLGMIAHQVSETKAVTRSVAAALQLWPYYINLEEYFRSAKQQPSGTERI